ncbi:VOC family protein [Agrobacterium cavarae]|uniref:VOC family protein n=1 Tax=Agrobacterium cavarae TaxID=2528239 RepID=UPI000DE0B98D|nr:VOC family protein [Agrobacterium cavarae]
MQPPKAILETVIYATDLDAAERFYRDVVGLEVVKTFKNQFVFLRCGEQMLLIFNPETSRIAEGGNPLPRHGTTGAGHVCFRAENKAEVDAWRDHFVAKGVEIDLYFRWDNGTYSVYVRDPAGNSVEIGEVGLWAS